MAVPAIGIALDRVTHIGATKEAGEPTQADRSVWYRCTAPGDMRVGFNVAGSAGALSAYTGANVNDLESVADGPWAVFAAGTTYQIAVEGAGDDDSGPGTTSELRMQVRRA